MSYDDETGKENEMDLKEESGFITPESISIPITGEGTVLQTCRHDRDPVECELCHNPFYDNIWRLVHKKNRNVLILVEGPPGTGKSYVSLRIAAAVDSGFNSQSMEYRVIFEPKEFLKLLNSADPNNPEFIEGKLYKGAVVIMEEFGVQDDHRKWYSFNNMVLNYIMQTFRFLNLIVIFNVPVAEYIDADARKLFQFHVETEDIVTDKVRAKIKEQSYNSTQRKIYKKFLRYRINSEWLRFEHWYFRKPPIAVFHKYEFMHKNYKLGLISKLFKEMTLLEKSRLDKTNKTLDTEAAANYVLENLREFIDPYHKTKRIDAVLIENHFKVGRFAATRVKKMAEKMLIEKGTGGKNEMERDNIRKKIRRTGGVLDSELVIDTRGSGLSSRPQTDNSEGGEPLGIVEAIRKRKGTI